MSRRRAFTRSLDARLRVAVVGYGYWGSKHARVLTAMADVALTIVDSDEVRLAHARRHFPNARVVAHLDDALPHVDAVVVATPPRTHSSVATAAMRAGCHVLVEKPLAVSVAECEALIATAEERRVVLMAGHTFEYNAAVVRLRELVQSGSLGDLYYIDCARLNLGKYQPDINVVWDLAPHDVSILNTLIGRLPVSVSAWGHRNVSELVEDVAYVRLTYADPAVSAYIHVSWLDPCKVRRVTVVGTEKMAVYNDMSDSERLRIYDTGVARDEDAKNVPAMPVSYRYGDIVSPFIAFDEPLAVQDEHFLRCIETGSRPRSDGASGLAVVRVLEATADALRTGRSVLVGGPPANFLRVRSSAGAGVPAVALHAQAEP